MRRLALVAALLVLPLLQATAAYGADYVICVQVADATCGESAATIHDAITVANTNGKAANTILVGPGTYNDGPYLLNGSTHALTLRGSGQGSTVLTLPASAVVQTYLTATQAAVLDLTIQMTAASSTGDTGMVLVGSTATRVSVEGTGTANASGVRAGSSGPLGSTITASSVLLTVGSGTRAVYSNGGTTITDSTVSGGQGFVQSAPTLTDTLSRLKIRADDQGVSTDSGTIAIDDSLVDLGSSAGTGLLAANFNPGLVDKQINANHVTVVGGGAGSRGAYAYAASPTVEQHSTIVLDNSIIEGPATDLEAESGNNGGPLAASTATITASFSEWTKGISTLGSNGTGGVVLGLGNLDVDPAFAGPGDYHLTPGSLLVDRGNPAPGGPALDLGGSARVTDGDGNGVAVRDMGAYEVAALVIPVPVGVNTDTVAPQTTITTKPAKRVTRPRVRFGFAASENTVSFTCKLDRGPWRPCATPARLRVKVGRHLFAVRAADAAGNTDATPATYRFRRVR